MNLFEELGQYCQLLYKTLLSSTEFRTYGNNFLSEMVKTGYDSLPIILLIGVFTGSVMTIQTAYQLQTSLIPKSTIGAIVTESTLIELAAVISSLVLAGRVGARMATELGTMRVSEQIDALESMGFNSVTYLVMPRLLAGIVMFPILYIFAATSGILGGVFSGALLGTLAPAEFMTGAQQYFYGSDVVFGLTKSLVFGFIIISVSCYKGYYATGGAEGVGKATTQATVLSCIYILFADLILASVLL